MIEDQDNADYTVNLLDRFAGLCAQNGSAPMFHFADTHGRPVDVLTRASLDTQASRVAALLQQEGLQAGDRVLLAYSFSLAVIPALLGCFRAGIIACPMASPNPLQLNRELPRFEQLASDSGCKAVLTDSGYARYRRLANLRSPLITRGTLWRDLAWLGTDGTLPPPLQQLHVSNPADIAFLQYTSGSTGAPKGVMITYRNLSTQIDAFRQHCRLTADECLVAWIPYYHDHCLVAGIFNTLFSGGQLYLMSPLSFLKNPSAWLDLLTHVRATGTAAPNFALDYAVQKTTSEQRRNWDLSSIRIFQSGGEPVLCQSVDRFLTAFAPSGLRKDAFSPAYGMAEHVLGIAVAGRKRIHIDRQQYEHARRVVLSDAPAALTLLSNGQLLAGVRAEIVDPDTRQQRQADEVGEIWVNSASKASGYWGKKELSEQVFNARLDGDRSGARFLRTGDLGFFHDGELYVAGRIKDTIIVRGRNIYPQDVEAIVASAHASIRPGRVIAFGLSEANTPEHLAVICELREKRVDRNQATAIASAIREQVTATLAISCRSVILARAGAVSKTTSGKHQRARTGSNYCNGTLDRYVLWHHTLPETAATQGDTAAQGNAPENPTPKAIANPAARLSETQLLKRLVAYVAAVDGREPNEVDVDAPLESLALDSLAIMGLLLDASTWLGRDILESQVMTAATLRVAARALTVVDHQAVVAPTTQVRLEEQEESFYPLNPSQAWMFEPDGPLPQGWSLGGMVETPETMDAGLLQRALDIVVNRHEALRLRLVELPQAMHEVHMLHATADCRQQHILAAGVESPRVAVVDFSRLPDAELRPAIERVVAERQQALNFTTGPIVQLVLIRLPTSHADRLLLLIHHIAVDAYSFELVATELLRLYEQLISAIEPILAPPSARYSLWMDKLIALTASDEITRSATHFQSMPTAPRLIVDIPDTRNLKGDATRESAWLPSQINHRLLQALPGNTGVPTATLVLTGALQALHRHTGQAIHGLELVHHGRKGAVDDVDLSRTGGWTSINCPVTLSITPDANLIEQARRVNAIVAGLPRHGLDYGLLRYLHPDASLREQMANAVQPQVKFMWFGQSNGILQSMADRYPPAPEAVGKSYERGACAHYLLYFYGTVVNGRIHLDVISSRVCFTNRTRARLLHYWLQALQELSDEGKSANVVTQPSKLRVKQREH